MGRGAQHTRQLHFQCQGFGAICDGDIQGIVFWVEDNSPYWLKPEEKKATRHDWLLTTSTSHKFNKGELQAQLAAQGIMAQGNAKQVQAVARQQGLPLSYKKQDVKYGWEGKPKGIEQVLWERGWIDGNRQKDYTMDGKEDSKEVLMKGTSLFLLMSNCTDFEGGGGTSFADEQQRNGGSCWPDTEVPLWVGRRRYPVFLGMHKNITTNDCPWQWREESKHSRRQWERVF